MDANYPVVPEQIGQPDPLAPGYVGTYSPTPIYFPTGTGNVVPGKIK
jgi:hypothetical protein